MAEQREADYGKVDNVNVTAVPEPSVALLAAALAGVLVRRMSRT